MAQRRSGLKYGQSLREQIQRTVDIDVNGCWLWRGSHGPASNGYGRIGVGTQRQRRSRLAHRVSYELLVGPIPDGLVLDHLCGVRHCVNPDHLEPVTQKENVRRWTRKTDVALPFVEPPAEETLFRHL